MPMLMASNTLSEGIPLAQPTDYPAHTKHVAGLVNGQLTDVMTLYFTDKIMVTITQGGRLAQWMQVPLGSATSGMTDHFLPPNQDENGLLPMSHLTATTILGASTPERETIGQLYATQIASAIALKNPEESRSVLVGLGLEKVDISRARFFDLMELVTQCL
ncbi:hypothetical protein MMC30_007129 [Trapelia coarctata]|nr:hypothetical protein [Trapelia coarctata]